MGEPQNEAEFLAAYGVTAESWTASELSWEAVQEIAADHTSRTASLRSSADYLANTISQFDCVHSVRWRVKATDHLVRKIVRKAAQGSEKYRRLQRDDYHTAITDLVGVRALHLYKNEWRVIDRAVRDSFELVEVPVIYYRSGDLDTGVGAVDAEPACSDAVVNCVEYYCQASGTLTSGAAEHRYEEHPQGYRSVHYLLYMRPTMRPVIAELQVRTIFEEGWSEVDHKIRYPDLEGDGPVQWFLSLLNRLAGSADEMSSFVQQLSEHLGDVESRLSAAAQERDSALVQLQETVAELKQVRSNSSHMARIVSRLESQVRELKDEAAGYSASMLAAVGEPLKSRLLAEQALMRRLKGWSMYG